MPGGVDDRELPVANAVTLATLHVVADIGAEIVMHPHRRIGRDADDRIAVGIGIAFVGQTVRQP